MSEHSVEIQSEEERKKTMDRLAEMMASVQKEVEREEELQQEHQEKESLEMHKEREAFDSSDDEDAEATTPVVMSETFNDEWAEFDQDQDQEQDHELDIEADIENDLNNDIDIEENFVPVDLSNDIAVNDVAAADPDFPQNPDAEVFAAPALIKAMPMFEKLSLSEPSKWSVGGSPSSLGSVLVLSP